MNRWTAARMMIAILFLSNSISVAQEAQGQKRVHHLNAFG